MSFGSTLFARGNLGEFSIRKIRRRINYANCVQYHIATLYNNETNRLPRANLLTFTVPPDLALLPLWPRPHVFPLPEPTPLPTLRFCF